MHKLRREMGNGKGHWVIRVATQEELGLEDWVFCSGEKGGGGEQREEGDQGSDHDERLGLSCVSLWVATGKERAAWQAMKALHSPISPIEWSFLITGTAAT